MYSEERLSCSNPLRSGTLISERFELLSQVGKGSLCLVFEALDQKTQKKAAVKILSPDARVDAADVERFKREAEILKRLRHPHIVNILAHGRTESGLLFIAMDLVAGESLQSKLDARETNPVFAVEDATNYIQQLSRALSKAHSLGIIHRDIKPANIILTTEGNIKLADFGLARSVFASEGLTVRGEVLGSGYFMSPEQHAGILVGIDSDYDHRSDIYSIGLVAYTLVVGAPPFSDRQLEWSELAALQTTVPIPKCSVSSGRAVPQWYERMIEIATAKQPNDRFQSADELLMYLETSVSEKGFWRSLFSRSNG